MTKAELRKIYKEKRKQITWKQIQQWKDLILINFQKIDLPFINCVHSYIAMQNQNEVETEHIIRYLKFINPGLRIAVPKINLNAGEMKHYIFNEEVETFTNSFGIIEPVNGKKIEASQIDLILTPLLAFDKRGYRVGYGKGFYDKFFIECRKNVIKIGLSFFEAEEAIDNLNTHDVPLNFCVTPQTVYTFN